MPSPIARVSTPAILPSGWRPDLKGFQGPALAPPHSDRHIQSMKTRLDRNAFLAALAIGLLGANAALAQIKPVEGQTVRAMDGAVLGLVTRVVTDPAGRPTQVLVQPKGARTASPHSLSVKSLTESPEGLKAPITKAEFDAMPVVDLEN